MSWVKSKFIKFIKKSRAFKMLNKFDNFYHTNDLIMVIVDSISVFIWKHMKNTHLISTVANEHSGGKKVNEVDR